MRKRVLQAVLVSIFVIILFSCANYQEYKEINKKIETEEIQISAKVGSTDNETLGNYLNLIPNNVTDALQDNDWGYILVSSNEMNTVASKYGYKENLIGLSIYSEHLIYISNKRIDTVIHETWHAYDSILGFPSKNKKAESIYTAEQNAFLKVFPNTNKMNVSTSMEYFAESFQQYVLNPNVLKKSCPKTYQFINKLVNKS